MAKYNFPTGIVLNHCYVTAKARKVSVVLINTSDNRIWIRQPLLVAEIFVAEFHPYQYQSIGLRIGCNQHKIPASLSTGTGKRIEWKGESGDKKESIFPHLDFINYLQRFLPHLVSKTTFLWEQVSHWDWNWSTDASFHQLKQCICNALYKTTLTYINCTKAIVRQTYVSEYGLGATLIQDGRPITFTTKTFTDIKIRYANIEWKCLSVCFRLERFHTYAYFRHITVHNDHKPLEMIKKKPFHTALPAYRECYYDYRNMIIPYNTS